MKIKRLFLISVLILLSVFVLSSCKNKSENEVSGSISVSESVTKNDFSSGLSTEKKDSTDSADLKESSSHNSNQKGEESASSKPFEPSEIQTERKTETAINSKLRLKSLGKSDGVMCAVVENVSDSDIEYTLLTATAKGENAEFVLSVLPKGESAILFERNKKKYSDAFLNAAWSSENEILFSEPLSVKEETFEIQCTDGALFIKNKSKENVDGTIYICYKSVIDGNLSGSVSFRMKTGNIKSGETKQLFSDNVKKNSKVIYVKYGS